MATVAIVMTTLGEYWVGATDHAVIGSGFGDVTQALEELGGRDIDLRKATDGSEGPADRLAFQAAHEVLAYLHGERKPFAVPLQYPRVTEFGRSVLDTVREVPFGATATYGDIAELAGRPRAARAVGTIMATCPFTVLVPCHRIVHAQMRVDLAGTTGWNWRKARLLELERG